MSNTFFKIWRQHGNINIDWCCLLLRNQELLIWQKKTFSLSIFCRHLLVLGLFCRKAKFDVLEVALVLMQELNQLYSNTSQIMSLCICFCNTWNKMCMRQPICIPFLLATLWQMPTAWAHCSRKLCTCITSTTDSDSCQWFLYNRH